MSVRNDPRVIAEAKKLFGRDIPELSDTMFLSEVVRLLRPLQEKNPAVDRFMKHHKLTEIYPDVSSAMAKKSSPEPRFTSSTRADEVAFHTDDINDWEAATVHLNKNR